MKLIKNLALATIVGLLALNTLTYLISNFVPSRSTMTASTSN